MPAIDSIATLAATAAGRVTQNSVILADNVYAGAGPDGLPGTADDYCLVRDGSCAPINIEGTVVVLSDVIIRGQITGQGVIYSGRNIHITGDLVYRNPPAWPKPDTDPETTARANAAKDLLILGAKGNVVVGNYTAAAWSNKVWNILTAPANIAPYAVSASDAAIGYDSDNNPANGYQFDGRLYVNEPNGGRRLSIGTNTVPRKFFESSLAAQHFNSLCNPDVAIVDAAISCNHAAIGKWGDGTADGRPVLNGALACRSDFTAFDGRFTMNWDIRLGSQSREHGLITLWEQGGGATGSVAITIGWKEIN